VSLAILIALVLFFILLAFKTAILTQAVVWVWRVGEKYSNKIFAMGPLQDQTPKVIGSIMIELGGDCFPLGVYPLPFWRHAILPLRKKPARVRVWLEGAVRTVVSLWFIVPVSALMLILAVTAPIGGRYSGLTTCAGYMCALLLLILMLVSAIGTFIGNVVFGELNLLQVGLPGSYPTVTRAAQGQMAAFMGSLLFSWIAASAAVTYTSAELGGFQRFSVLDGASLGAAVERYIEASYFVALAALGVTEIDATTAAAKLLIFLTLLLGLSLIAFLLALLVGVVGDASRAGPNNDEEPRVTMSTPSDVTITSSAGNATHADVCQVNNSWSSEERAHSRREIALAVLIIGIIAAFLQRLSRRRRLVDQQQSRSLR
jgi:hypothetical protein